MLLLDDTELCWISVLDKITFSNCIRRNKHKTKKQNNNNNKHNNNNKNPQTPKESLKNLLLLGKIIFRASITYLNQKAWWQAMELIQAGKEWNGA